MLICFVSKFYVFLPFPEHLGENNEHLVLAVAFIYCMAIIIFTLSHKGHIKITTKRPIIVTENKTQSREKRKNCRVVILIESEVCSNARVVFFLPLGHSSTIENNNNLPFHLIASFSDGPTNIVDGLFFNETSIKLLNAFKDFHR
jgi:hypothetical protein